MAVADRINGLYVDVVFGASAVVDLSAPTVAELTTGKTLIECAIVEGPATPRTGTTIDITGLCDTKSRMKAGTIQNDPITMTIWREPGIEGAGTDAYWTLFDDATSGSQFLGIARSGFTSGAPTAGDIVDMFEVEVMSREASAPVRGEAQRFVVTLAVIDDNYDAVVAA